MAERTDPTAAPPAEPEGIERRVYTRFAGNLATSCRVTVAVRRSTIEARVRNISAGGISLIVSQPAAPGSLVQIDLRHTQRNYRRGLELRVLYCIEHPSGEWILGGSYLEGLSTDELALFAGGRLG